MSASVADMKVKAIPLVIPPAIASRRMPASAKLVHGYLATTADLMPRLKEIADRCGISLRTASKSLQYLTTNGLMPNQSESAK